MKFGIFVFPGSNCDHDCYHAVKHVLGHEAKFIWHSTPDTSDCDCLILPGGFSYGDYLRPGAIAKISHALTEITAFSKKGKLVIGICNGFQILLESGLLPGAMIKNKYLKFICRNISLKVEQVNTPFTRKITPQSIINLPIAHADGSYFAPEEDLKKLQDQGRIILRYCNSQGIINDQTNPNGSVLNIAGIVNEKRNIIGMMPHPERAVEKSLGGVQGRLIFESIIESVS